MDEKKILIIAYHFPPDAAVGAIRPQKFVKYLPTFGWQPFVLTIGEKYIEKQDATRLRDVQDILIFRTKFFRAPIEFFLSLRDKFLFKGSAFSYASKSDSTQPGVQVKTSIGPIKQFIAELSKFPDDKICWLFPAIIKGWEIIRKYQIKVIYCTSPPHSVDIIGMFLAKLTGCKLIVDHRDPWAACRDRTELRPILSLHHYFERLVLKSASAILTTTQRYAIELGGVFPEHKHKIFPILNGFDGSDFDLQADRNSDKFVMTYVGSFYSDRSPEFFLKAVRRLFDADLGIKERIEINFVGFSERLGSNRLEDLIEENGLNDVVRVTGWVSYQESLMYVLRSNLLLLFAPNQPLQIPAKTFEYMAAKIPILALTEDGATADLILSFNAGLVAQQNNADQIYEALKVFLLPATSSTPDWYSDVDVTMFARKELTRQLTEILFGI